VRLPHPFHSRTPTVRAHQEKDHVRGKVQDASLESKERHQREAEKRGDFCHCSQSSVRETESRSSDHRRVKPACERQSNSNASCQQVARSTTQLRFRLIHEYASSKRISAVTTLVNLMVPSKECIDWISSPPTLFPYRSHRLRPTPLFINVAPHGFAFCVTRGE
jgi:hypothetical protein